MATDYNTPVGQVRLLIGDESATPIFSDEQITGFLAINPIMKRAAADALDAIASSEALLSKKITTQDRATDGPAVAAELRKHAIQLRAQADADDDTEDSYFDITPFQPYWHHAHEAEEWRY